MLSFKKKCDSKVEFLSKRNVIQKNAFFQKEAWLGKVVSLKEKRAWVTANSVCCRRCLVVVVMFWMGWYWCCCCLQVNPKGSTFTVESHSEKPVFFFRFSQLWHRISSACQPNITFAVATALMQGGGKGGPRKGGGSREAEFPGEAEKPNSRAKPRSRIPRRSGDAENGLWRILHTCPNLLRYILYTCPNVWCNGTHFTHV